MEVNEDQIVKWKEEHGKVFRTQLGDEIIYFTTLKRDVYVDLMSRSQTENEFDFEVETLNVCLLNKKVTLEELEVKSGIGVTLMEQVMLKSGWQQIESEEL